MTKLIAALALLALSGCATCREYPTACAAVTLVAVGAVAFSLNHSSNSTTGTDGRDYTIIPVNCSNPQVCK